ncbi:MAG: ImmA/IrrE family metallo-endopeptidase [Acidobacteriaceae bacterium]|nr:ImmA/IrrE family metallo-endopeptidase [Acidobacteriaceae bacterium]
MKVDKDALAFIRRLQKSVPVNIEAIAAVLGLTVWESSRLPEGIAGKLKRDIENGGPSQFSIIVRAQDPLVRKRFTVAHELAHYLLHRHLFTDELVDDALYRSTLKTSVEAEANSFAADLLMPRHLLEQYPGKSIQELAFLFKVSEQAMGIRLDTLPIQLKSMSNEPLSV